MTIESTYDWIVLFCAISSIFLNILLLWLIIALPHDNLGNFRLFFISGAVLSILYSLIHGSLAPTWLLSERLLLYCSLGGLSHEAWAKPFLVCFICIFLQKIIVITASFVYRFFLLFNPNALLVLAKPRWICFIIITDILLITSWAFVLSQYCCSSEEVYYAASSMFLKTFGFAMDKKQVYIGILRSMSNDQFLRFAIVITVLLSSLFIMLTIILYCIKAILASFWGIQMSTRNKRQHRQLFCLLILQSANPFLFSFLPTAIIIVSFLSNAEIGYTAKVISCQYGFLPVMNPLIIMGFVRQYRSFIMKLLIPKAIIVENTKMFKIK